MDRLREYERRRDFRRTPEPPGKRAVEGGARFVIQKHAARRLHYDLRLELDGVLKSWAVPKGPSLDPSEKRLAVHVEDHPLDYADFEGVIPAGQYGAGTVMVWDTGTWEAVGDAREGYRKGRLHLRLTGARLRGEWVLARMHGAEAGENKQNWLLLKVRDAYARPGASADDDRAVSVLSGRTLAEIGAHPEFTWGESGRERAEPPHTEALPPMIGAQLATLVSAPPRGPDWLHEIKFDGYRTLCRIERGKVTLFSRNGKDWTGRFGALARAVRALPLHSGWLDGEVAVLLPDGRTSFGGLQQALSAGRDHDLVYFLFDLLYANGEDLTRRPLRERKALLAGLLEHLGTAVSPLRLAEHIEGDGEAVFQEACRLGLEGVVSKRAGAGHVPARTRDWLKVKCLARQEFVIGGFSAPSGARSGFGALLLGVYEGPRLRYVGRVGTGFDEATLRDLRARLDALVMPVSPFADAVPRARSGKNVVSFVQPVLVAEVAFVEWTADGVLRQPSFQGLREDKAPHEVHREGAAGIPPPVPATSAPGAPLRTRIAGLRLSNPDKVLYPEQGLTKRDLALYYASVADHLLPDLAGRPLTLLRCPEGHHQQCFFQKHATTGLAAGIRRIPIAEKQGSGIYLAVDDLAGVIGLVQMGVLELHTWGAHADAPEKPDRLVFDVDPDEGLPWEAVTTTVLALRARLADLGLTAFLKTTGGKGLHVVVPLLRRHAWDEVKQFAHALARSLVYDAPRAYTTNPSKAARRGKVYLDYLRNGRGATAIANYSTRARPGAPVAVPIAWEQVQPLRSDAFRIDNLAAHLAARAGDPWADYMHARAAITKPMKHALGLT
ncbi:MAG: DNA ligase D [Gammaproteobacteria bacterium]|nr:DNA ligase D [Gammaproteobacteria bacterium]